MHTKICGITTLEDAEAAVSAGAWAIGMIHAPGSPRRIDDAEAERIRQVMSRIGQERDGIADDTEDHLDEDEGDVERDADREGLAEVGGRVDMAETTMIVMAMVGM